MEMTAISIGTRQPSVGGGTEYALMCDDEREGCWLQMLINVSRACPVLLNALLGG